jgi:hypothetical protein
LGLTAAAGFRGSFNAAVRPSASLHAHDTVAVAHSAGLVPRNFHCLFSLTPLRRLRTAERRRSCNVRPEYIGSYGRSSTLVVVSSPQAATLLHPPLLQIRGFLRFDLPEHINQSREQRQGTGFVGSPAPAPTGWGSASRSTYDRSICSVFANATTAPVQKRH